MKQLTNLLCTCSARSLLHAALFVLAPALSLGCSVGRADEVARDGDIIFQTSKSSQSLAIQSAARSGYSHMGMIVRRGGQSWVLEASASVRYTPLSAWIARGVSGHFVLKRLRDASHRLTPEALARAKAVIAKLLGKPYDLTFEWSDRRMYCSELVWKIYHRALGVRIGELAPLRDVHR